MQDINSNAVYVQIAPDSVSLDSNDSNSNNTTDDKVKCELYMMCGIIVASMCFAFGLGIYFLIVNH
jgi:hypothetical protein